MALIPNFSSGQTLNQPNLIYLTDISTGSDTAITGRNIFLQKSDGTFSTPTGSTTDYILWPLANNSTSVNVLIKDTALNITVNWLDVNGAVLYTKAYLNVFTLYNETFDYSLAASEESKPIIVNSANYYFNRIKLRLAINDAKNSVVLATSITNAQAACDRGTYLRINPQLFY